jgi:hypothetical protein
VSFLWAQQRAAAGAIVKYWQASSGIVSLFAVPHSGQVMVDSEIMFGSGIAVTEIEQRQSGQQADDRKPADRRPRADRAGRASGRPLPPQQRGGDRNAKRCGNQEEKPVRRRR